MEENMKRFFRFTALGFILAAGALTVGLLVPQRLVSQYASPVNVMNSKAAPAQIRNTDNPALQPFEEQLTLTGGGSVFSFNGGFTVPAGKRLVIQDVQFRDLTAGDIFSISVVSNSAFVSFFALPQFASGLYLFDFRGPIYADPGPVSIEVQTQYSPTGTQPATVSGYYVNIP
jgi:hypothetical protein